MVFFLALFSYCLFCLRRIDIYTARTGIEPAFTTTSNSYVLNFLVIVPSDKTESRTKNTDHRIPALLSSTLDFPVEFDV